MTQDESIDYCERQIAALLRDLEKKLGAVAEDISIESVEITKMSDSRRQYARNVRIRVSIQPGSSWNV